jgi:hypothetical protein
MERVKIPAVTAAPAVATSRRGPPRIIVCKFRGFRNAESFRDLSPSFIDTFLRNLNSHLSSFNLKPRGKPQTEPPSSIPNLHIHSFQHLCKTPNRTLLYPSRIFTFIHSFQHLWQEGSLGFQIWTFYQCFNICVSAQS